LAGALPPILPKKGETEAGVPCRNNIAGNVMVHPYRIETNLLQLFAHPESSEGFSVIYVIIFEINIAAKQKEA